MRIVHPSMTRSDVARSIVAAALTENPLRFLRYETVSLAGPRAVTYRLRGRDAAAVIRHGTTDVEELALIFLRSLYALPSGARAALGAADRTLRIVDLGARTGLRGLSLLGTLAGAELISVEPDPMNLIILRRTIAANSGLRWREIAGAVGDGEYLHGPGYARRLAPGLPDAERQRISAAVDLGEVVDGADLVAMNLQGAEWELLSDPRLRQSAARVVIVECHRRGCPGADPIPAGGRLLAEAGFTTVARRKGRGADGILLGWRA